VTFFHRLSRTLLLTDLVVNLEAGKLPLHARAFAWATGVLAPDGKAPAYLRRSTVIRIGSPSTPKTRRGPLSTIQIRRPLVSAHSAADR
jgi:hypothetical protein